MSFCCCCTRPDTDELTLREQHVGAVLGECISAMCASAGVVAADRRPLNILPDFREPAVGAVDDGAEVLVIELVRREQRRAPSCSRVPGEQRSQPRAQMAGDSVPAFIRLEQLDKRIGRFALGRGLGYLPVSSRCSTMPYGRRPSTRLSRRSGDRDDGVAVPDGWRSTANCVAYVRVSPNDERRAVGARDPVALPRRGRRPKPDDRGAESGARRFEPWNARRRTRSAVARRDQ